MKHTLTILSTPNVLTSVEFYNTFFAKKPHIHVNVYAEYILENNQRIGLYAQDSLAQITGQISIQPVPPKLGAVELYFYPQNLKDAIARAEVAGARQLSPLQPRDWGDKVIYYADPFGIIIALAEKINKINE